MAKNAVVDPRIVEAARAAERAASEDLAQELWRLWPFLPDAVKGRLVGIAGEHAHIPKPN